MAGQDYPLSHESSRTSVADKNAKEADKNAKEDEDVRAWERIVCGGGAALLSAVFLNPLDVIKTRLQAQGPHHASSNYKGGVDALVKIIQQEGVLRLWRATSASLLLAVPTVGIYMPCYDILRNRLEALSNKNAPYLVPYAPLFAGSIARSIACIVCSPIELARTRMQAEKIYLMGGRPPGMRETLLEVMLSVKHASPQTNLQGLRVLWTGAGAQLARDVPFSAICWFTLEPLRRRLLDMVDTEAQPTTIFAVNFSSGLIGGGIAAGLTCPLDVAKTRRQIQDPTKARKISMRQSLFEIWRESKLRGLFSGLGPRMARAGPAVGLVVSFYEVLKHVLHKS